MTSYDLQDKLLFANKLEQLIGDRDKRAICKDLHIKYDSLLDWLGARRYPSKQSLDKLSKYFHVSISVLICKTSYWHMSDEEIINSYKQAKNKKEQIIILADLNDVSIKMVKQKLKELGLSEKVVKA